MKYIAISWTVHRMQNFRRLYQRGWSGQIASLTPRCVPYSLANYGKQTLAVYNVVLYLVFDVKTRDNTRIQTDRQEQAHTVICCRH